VRTGWILVCKEQCQTAPGEMKLETE